MNNCIGFFGQSRCNFLPIYDKVITYRSPTEIERYHISGCNDPDDETANNVQKSLVTSVTSKYIKTQCRTCGKVVEPT